MLDDERYCLPACLSLPGRYWHTVDIAFVCGYVAASNKPTDCVGVLFVGWHKKIWIHLYILSTSNLKIRDLEMNK